MRVRIASGAEIGGAIAGHHETLGREKMVRILVQDDDGQTVLLDERALKPEHFTDRHSAAQLIERVEWAVGDGRVKRDVTRLRVPPEPALSRTFD